MKINNQQPSTQYLPPSFRKKAARPQPPTPCWRRQASQGLSIPCHSPAPPHSPATRNTRVTVSDHRTLR